jgi:hypothetical protein
MCQQKLQSALAQAMAKIQTTRIAVQLAWQALLARVCAYVCDCAYPCDICKYRPAEQPDKTVDQ